MLDGRCLVVVLSGGGGGDGLWCFLSLSCCFVSVVQASFHSQNHSQSLANSQRLIRNFFFGIWWPEFLGGS